MFKKILQQLFKKEIEALARELEHDQALDEYMEANFDFSKLSKGELNFRGQQMARYMADCFYEVLETNEAENYVTINLSAMKENSDGVIVTIQRIAPGALSPHAMTEHFRKKYEDLKQKYDSSRPE